MSDIDFLPDSYRQQHVQRNDLLYRGLICAAFALMLGGATLLLWRQRAAVDGRLNILEQEQRAAETMQLQLAQAQTRLQETAVAAELAAFLHHPWPRTRVLSEVLASLPSGVRIDHVQISHGLPRGDESPAWAGGLRHPSDADNTPPLQRDLQSLRKAYDRHRGIVLLEGTVRDRQQLHRYVHELTQAPLVENVELLSIESKDAQADAVFRLRAVLRAGPGQADATLPADAGERSQATPSDIQASVPRTLSWRTARQFELRLQEGARR